QTLTLVGGTLDNSKWWDDLVTPDFYIGARLTSGALSAFFNGTIDDVRIYNRALSATEIKQLYNLGR
ncbi:MAG TPA: LamG-like jellyroll fold domain-containing protein, partial [Candidatus Paceibacterota bacterium]